MQTQFFKPQPALHHLVHNIMISGSRLSPTDVLRVTPFPPLSQHALYFYIKDPITTQFFGQPDFRVMPKTMIIGPQQIRVNIKLGYDNLMIRVGFQPGGLHKLVKFSMHEILDYPCNGADVFGTEINQVHERLSEAADFTAMKNIVEAFLVKKTSYQVQPFTTAIQYLIQNNGNTPISQLAYQTGLSTRQFERKCNEFLGFSPKLFSRITRFSKAYRLRENNPGISWTAIAYQCGYFDQMHLIRDFKEFAGVTPTFIEHELSLTPFRLQTDISF